MKWLDAGGATLLYGEMPNLHTHTIKVATIELDEDCRDFDIEAFRRVIDRRLYKLEPLCYQLVYVPFKFHNPMWREHCDVDLTYHIRPWRLPAPGGRRELDKAIGEIASTPLDRTRPLWEMYFVEGLANNRVAVVCKIHHALVDGVAAANLLARCMNLQPGPEGATYPPDPVLTTRQLMTSALADHLRLVGLIPRTILEFAQFLVRVRRNLRKLLPPFSPPPTFMNHGISSPERRSATTTFALADVKQTGKHLGVTINDFVLALSTGALRTLLLRYDGKADPLVAFNAVSLDLSPDRISGNNFSGMLVVLPVDLGDPLEWVRRCRESATAAKESQQHIGLEMLLRWFPYIPPVVAEAILRWAWSRSRAPRLNLTISNVTGPRERGRVGGGLVTEIYSAAPLGPGCGLTITVWSYADQFNITVLTDGATVKDPHEVTAAINAAFSEIRRGAGLSESLTVVATAMAPS